MMNKTHKDILYPELSYKLCGLFYRIHNELKRFCNEKQYADALENLLKSDTNYCLIYIPLFGGISMKGCQF